MTDEGLEIVHKRLDFNEKVPLAAKKEELKEQDIRLNRLCFDYHEKEKRIAELEKELKAEKEYSTTLRTEIDEYTNSHTLCAKYKELEKKISILLSCKNCPDNKGGLLCQKEYEDKCLAQKIQYIKELQEEIAELKAYNEKLLDGDIEKHNKIVELQNCNGELARQKASLERWLGEAKELLREIIDTPVFTQMGGELYENEGYAELVEETEQFLKEIK